MIREMNLKFVKDLNTNSEVLKKIFYSKSTSDEMKTYIALHPNTPINILKKLALDEDDFLRHNVVQNINLPLDSLKILMNDKIVDIRLLAERHPTTKEFLQNEIEKDFDR